MGGWWGSAFIYLLRPNCMNVSKNTSTSTICVDLTCFILASCPTPGGTPLALEPILSFRKNLYGLKRHIPPTRNLWIVPPTCCLWRAAGLPRLYLHCSADSDSLAWKYATER